MNPAPTTTDLHSYPRRRTLGRSAVAVPELGLGGAGIGNLYRAISDEDAIAALRCASEMHIEYLDTAPYYGFGLSESRIGDALRSGMKRPILSTKVGRVLEPASDVNIEKERHGFFSPEPFEPHFDYSYDGVLRSHESSLRRLGVDRIDVLLCHDIGAVTHGADHEQRLKEFLDGGYRAMVRLREESAVGAIGLGVNEWQVCAQLLPLCDLDCLLLAGRYTLLEQPALEHLFPLCAERHVSVIVGGPFNSGILAIGGQAVDAHYNYESASAQIRQRVQRIANVCRTHGVPVPAAALQFPLAHPQVAAVVPGCSSAAEVGQAARWMNVRIPADLWRELRAEGLLHAAAPVPS
jgi:D-threo-aldose 1-dehydrogenase